MLPDPFSSKISRGSVLLHLSVLLQLNCKCLKTQWINRNSIAVRVFENVILCTIWTYLHLKSSENSGFLFSNPTFSDSLLRFPECGLVQWQAGMRTLYSFLYIKSKRLLFCGGLKRLSISVPAALFSSDKWRQCFCTKGVCSRWDEWSQSAIDISSAVGCANLHFLISLQNVLYRIEFCRYASRQTEKRYKTYSFRWAISRAVRWSLTCASIRPGLSQRNMFLCWKKPA